jgi:NAD(P)-dependent dehydrogenase (short-subunit alcohol dehydrogenase family)
MLKLPRPLPAMLNRLRGRTPEASRPAPARASIAIPPAGLEALLARQHVLVTGAGRNIGKAIVLEALAAGARVTFTDREPDRCLALEADLRDHAELTKSVTADASNLDDNLRLVGEIDASGRPVTVLVNNVGTQPEVSGLLDFDPGEFRAVLDTNVVGPLHLTRLVVDRMVRHGIRGSIVFLLSIHAETVSRTPAYSASKAALSMLVRELAVDLAPHGIRVNGIAPGWIWEEEVVQPHTPLYGTVIPPRYIGRAACFLASEYFSRHTTGTVVTVDGGLSLFNHIVAAERARAK